MAERFLSARPGPEAAKRTLDGKDRSDKMKREGGKGIAQRSDCATPRPRTGFQGLRRCGKVLQYQFNWRHLYAMLIGDAHVSTGDQETAAHAAAAIRS